MSKHELKIDAQSACHIFKQVIQRVLRSVIVECLASEWIILQNVYINSKMIKKDHSPILIKNIYQESEQLKGGESLEIISAITGTWNDKCHIRPQPHVAVCSVGGRADFRPVSLTFAQP